MIVCYYIECNDEAKLEATLHKEGYAFYDATSIGIDEGWKCLEDVEIALENK